MTGRLDRALKAVRELETGVSPRAQETLDRILLSANVSRRARSRVARWLPLAAVLAISTAALAQPRMRETIRGFFSKQRSALYWVQPTGDGRSVETTSTQPAVTLSGVTSRDSATVVSMASSTVMPPAPLDIELSSGVASAVEVATAPARSLTSPSRAPPDSDRVRMPAARSIPSAPSAKEAATHAPVQRVLSEEDVYERAHRLHFQDQSAAASVMAWDEYLGRFPSGRFVPEAQYNRAIDLLKLERYVEARAALLPFAEGAYGAYHRDDARDLLKANGPAERH